MPTIFHLRPVTPNIGNQVIVGGLVRLLEEAFPEGLNVVPLPARGRDAGFRDGGLTPRNVHQINQLADGLIIGPGNLFENGGLDVDLGALAALRVPMAIFSVSHGRIIDREGRFIPRTDSLSDDRTRAVCRAAEVTLVRDEHTLRHLESLGVERAKVIGCPSLLLSEKAPPLPVDPRARDRILISVRHPNLMSVPFEAQGRVWLDTRRLIDRLERRGRVALVCHDYQDLPFAAAFPDVPMLYTEDPGQFLGWLAHAALTVTFRLHAFLPAAALGTPSVNFSYDERASALIDAVGLGPWNIDYLRHPAPLMELEHRLGSLDDFDDLCESARPIQRHLAATMRDELGRWRDRIRDRTATAPARRLAA
jgi:hypothetical protein